MSYKAALLNCRTVGGFSLSSLTARYTDGGVRGKLEMLSTYLANTVRHVERVVEKLGYELRVGKVCVG